VSWSSLRSHATIRAVRVASDLEIGAPLSRKAALRTDLLIRAAKVGHMEAVKVLLGTGKAGHPRSFEIALGP
jgi:hypothetical protein